MLVRNSINVSSAPCERISLAYCFQPTFAARNGSAEGLRRLSSKCQTLNASDGGWATTRIKERR